MTPAKKQTSKNDSWAGSAADWRARNVHRAELWSGMRILFRFPTLGEMITSGALPDDLLELAALEYAEPGIGAQLIAQSFASLDEDTPKETREAAGEQAQTTGRQLAALNRELCAAALVEPKLTADEIADAAFPVQDLEMLAGFLTRRVQFDAAGRRIGVEPLDTFREFHLAHGLPEDCEECAARAAVSSVHAGAL